MRDGAPRIVRPLRHYTMVDHQTVELPPSGTAAHDRIGSAQPKKFETGTLYVARRTREREQILLTTESPERHGKGNIRGNRSSAMLRAERIRSSAHPTSKDRAPQTARLRIVLSPTLKEAES
jgi:hypothetical protein